MIQQKLKDAKRARKTLKNKHLNPWPLESSNPFLQLNWRRTLYKWIERFKL